jgi:CBS domain-containing protein
VKEVITIDDTITVKGAEEMIRTTQPHRAYPVLDEAGNLSGMITRKDIDRVLEAGRKDVLIREIMARKIITCYPDENLKTALHRLGEGGIGRIPVVERAAPRRLVGLITREGIIDAYNQLLKK